MNVLFIGEDDDGGGFITDDATGDLQVERTPSGVPGLDVPLGGGLPVGRATLIAGTAGCGTTLAAIHFAIDGAAEAGHAAIHVSFEETADQLRRTMRSMGRDPAKLEREDKLAILDAVPADGEQDDGVEIVGGNFDLSALAARIEAAADRIKAGRVAIKSLAGLAGLFTRGSRVDFVPHVDLRPALHRLINSLKSLGLTLLLTGERDTEGGAITRFGLDEFVADGVLLLRNTPYGERSLFLVFEESASSSFATPAPLA